MLDSIQHARQVRQIIHRAWWSAYCAPHRDPEPAEDLRLITGALKRVTDEAKEKFGTTKYPGCQACLEYSVFGGPSHEPSPGCRSGKRPHCTCDTCW